MKRRAFIGSLAALFLPTPKPEKVIVTKTRAIGPSITLKSYQMVILKSRQIGGQKIYGESFFETLTRQRSAETPQGIAMRPGQRGRFC